MRVTLASGIAADIYLSQPEAWGTTLLRATGNALHLERLGAIPDQAATEEEVYASHGLPFIPPELRSGHEEFERFEEIPSLVTLSDINGEFHAHTTWSDGAASVRANGGRRGGTRLQPARHHRSQPGSCRRGRARRRTTSIAANRDRRSEWRSRRQDSWPARRSRFTGTARSISTTRRLRASMWSSPRFTPGCGNRETN